MPKHRIKEQNVLRYDGSCDVCGNAEAAGYYLVVYDADSLNADLSEDRIQQHECFDCHTEAKSRDRQRERETLDTHLV